MKLIAGLGNPGERYKNNRHNVGWRVLDRLAKKIQNNDLEFKLSKKHSCYLAQTQDFLLAKPTTQMNSSGVVVSSLASFFKIQPENIWVIHDDLDIKLGQYKVQRGKGPKIHKGLNSIYERFGKTDFWHVRVGVENRKKPLKILNFQLTRKVPGERYVLQDFTDEEVEILNPIIGSIVVDLNSYLSK